ncbi:tetratricopeptide repeat protein [Sphingosinicella rhizophila]|uniref:Tetratricopeptide repeat protein n=1 Tax=Sphingosinicella rhizophila TaxID=3050082 RepID=A0ABU3Q9Q2_9SPHN|nr:tetratricopeptide repeat protein [Sphingosinicella sp. GR2756]MDT9600128.1 tetratricopeptide repeat protein [Sphingosinicella sp. GR2756]
MRKLLGSGFLKASALAGAGVVLGSFAPVPSFSSAALAMMDPTRLASALCGGRAGASGSMQGLAAAAAVAASAGAAARPMPLYSDLAATRRPVTTANIQARRYFAQGLLLTYGFSHAGAVRSFREAQSLDPNCASCWWGEALALGPNINAPMDDRDTGAALAALDRALKLRARASPVERALIDALSHRYSRDPKADRAALDAAYADRMLDVARNFPNDDDVAVLAAEAVMDTSPWNYWQADKVTPVGRSGEAVRLIETVIARSPDHAQAAHLYIHLMENSADPGRAEAAADRLARPLAPSAGHLVHMPAHIYGRIGRYRDAIHVNVAAARADEAFIRATGDRGLVRYGYYPHNVHFIVSSAQMAGDMATAVREARRLRTLLDPDISARIAWIQAIDAAPYLAMAQVAKPKAILAMPPADPRLPYAVGMRLYARAVAQAQRRDRAEFEREIAALAALRTSGAFAAMIEQGVPATELLSIAEAVARGRLAQAEGRFDEAARRYRQAIALEGKIPYQEPPYWYYPVNQSLGAALYQAGRYEEARQAFRTALLQTPRNGWVLYGLARTEEALGNRLEAAAARQAFRRDWVGNRNWLRMERL